MQVTVEKTSELRRKMTVSIPDAVVQEKMESRIKSLSREVKIDGFRPGKAPARIVKSLYGDRVLQEISGDLIQTTYYEALQQENLTPIGQPSILPVETAAGGFEYVAEFEVYPEIPLQSLNQIALSKPVAEVSEQDVDDMVEKLRFQRRSWHAVERASQLGDQVVISFSGVCNGENFTNGKTENFPVELGAGQMIAGFEAQLTGVLAGDQKTFTCAFPEQYVNPKLAGQEAEFTVDVLRVEESQLPEIDEEFVKSYGVEAGDLESFRADVRANMERELQSALKTRLKNSVLNTLCDTLQLDIPHYLIDQEIQNMMTAYAEQARRVGQNPDLIQDAEIVQTFETQARRRVTVSLIMSEVIKANNITLDPFKVRAVVDEISKSYETPDEVVNWYYADKSRLQDVQQMVIEEQAIDWIIGQASVAEQTISFQDAMDKQTLEASNI